MRADGISPLDPARPPSPAERSPAPARPGEFARLLQRRLTEPRERVDRVRAALEAIRDGAAIRGGGSRAAGAPSAGAVDPRLAALLPYRAGQPNGPDPFGWRARSRALGDALVTPGFGAIFERQIEQESGFAPEVAFGLQQSSAGARGIAQLMPEYYPGVDATDPEASLAAAARTMNHYLAAFDGDVRPALASYNAGLGRVQSLIAEHGDGWESALPEETQRYLAAIVGDARPRLAVDPAAEVAVFGGLGPGGVLTPPLDRVFDERAVNGVLDLLAAAGVAVRAPAAGRVLSVGDGTAGSTLTLDHGNGWRTLMDGLAALLVTGGQDVRRGEPLAALAEGPAAGQGRLRFGVSLDGRLLAPGRYLLRP